MKKLVNIGSLARYKGGYDKKQVDQDCNYHNLPNPFSEGHRNLKKEFSDALPSKKRFGVGLALRKLGLEFEGTAHRGIDDARNIARICIGSPINLANQ